MRPTGNEESRTTREPTFLFEYIRASTDRRKRSGCVHGQRQAVDSWATAGRSWQGCKVVLVQVG